MGQFVEPDMEAAQQTFESVLHWADSTDELHNLVKKPEIRDLLAYITTSYMMPKEGIVVISKSAVGVVTMIAQASFMMGYKRGLDTAKLDKSFGRIEP